jgi:leader peptidase (prepilin peptidase)/N-methyltransferase
MTQAVLAGTLLGGAVAVLASPYLARLTLSVPDREDPRWWAGTAAGGGRLAATAGAAGVLGLLGGHAVGWSALLPAWVALALCCAPLAVIDVERHRLPNRLVFPAAGAGAVLLALAALARGQWHPLLRAVEAGALVFAIFFLLALMAPFGFGDVKLGGVLAGYLGWLGWSYVLYGLLAGFVLASVASLPLVLARRATMKSAIPLGPALIAGTFVVAAFQLVP